MNLLLHFLSEKPPLAVTEILWTSLKGSPHRRESSRSLASQSTAHSPGGLHGRGMGAVAFPGLFCMSIALQSFENSNQDWIYNYYIRYYKIYSQQSKIWTRLKTEDLTSGGAHFVGKKHVWHWWTMGFGGNLFFRQSRKGPKMDRVKSSGFLGREVNFLWPHTHTLTIWLNMW